LYSKLKVQFGKVLKYKLLTISSKSKIFIIFYYRVDLFVCMFFELVFNMTVIINSNNSYGENNNFSQYIFKLKNSNCVVLFKQSYEELKSLSLFEWWISPSFQLTLRLSEKDHIKSESVLMFKNHMFLKSNSIYLRDSCDERIGFRDLSGLTIYKHILIIEFKFWNSKFNSNILFNRHFLHLLFIFQNMNQKDLLFIDLRIFIYF
jgi:hypothetical protein